MSCRQRVHRWVCGLVRAQAVVRPELEVSGVSCCMACRECARKGHLAVQHAVQGAQAGGVRRPYSQQGSACTVTSTSALKARLWRSWWLWQVVVQKPPLLAQLDN